MAVIRTGIKCRRRRPRFVPPDEYAARVKFDFPAPGGRSCTMQLKDISAGGLCFVLGHDLPGLDVGESIDQAMILAEDHRIHGDLFVMHLTPDDTEGSVCGALFFPHSDDDIISFQALIAQLERREAGRRESELVTRD